ncbi:hypothetical protein ANTPLA_LOCUS8105 [Anthophora plagiata]
MIRSVLEYAIPIYHEEGSKTKDFDKIQNKGLRIAMGYRTTTPINVMHAKAGLMRIQQRVELLAERYNIRQIAGKKSEENINLLENRIFKREERFKEEWDDYTFTNAILTEEGKIKQRNNSINDHTLMNIIREKLRIKENKPTIIFIDGSKAEEGRANEIGIITKENDCWKEEGISIDNRMSIYTTEAIALSKSMEKAKQEYPNKAVIILSDSESVIKAITKGFPKKGENSWIIKIMKQPKNCCKRRQNNREGGHRLGIAWIPAHMGIEGNERADRIAKEKTRNDHYIEFKIPEEDLIRNAEEEAWKRSRNKNKEEGTHKGIKYLNSGVSNNNKKTPWFTTVSSLERKSIVTLSRIRVNHYNLNESLERKNLVNSAECECGHGVQDIDHVIWQCPMNEEQRRILENQLEHRGIDRGVPVMDILKANQPANLRLIAAFINKLGRTI